MEAGRLIASGRDGDIFEFGPGRVLRKARDGRSLASEARIITYARDHGYPAPEIHELRANDSELVMERVDGPLMVDAMLRRIWRLRDFATMLADLHDQLHEIPGPGYLRQMPDGGDRLLHLDLHPLNVIVSERGPVVIDWTNAARGEGSSDVAVTFVLLTCPRVPGSAVVRGLAGPVRRTFARAFARRYRGPALDARIAEMAELKTLDRNMHPDEVVAMQKLAAQKRAKEAG